MKNTLLTATLFSTVFALGCSAVTSSGTDEEQLLPDNGPTTAELIQGNQSGMSYYGDGGQSPYIGQPLMPHYQPESSYSNTHIQELKRDFKRVPNPEIVGYVYPHINNNEMPVPGYYTTFPLYNRNHFALDSEGYNE